MLMIGGLRVVNALIVGTITSGDLETALTTGGQLGQWEQVTTVRAQCRLLARSANAMSRIVGSAAARASVFSNPDMVREMSLSAAAMSAIAGSSASMTIAIANDNVMATFARSRVAMDAIYAVPANITAIMPTAWAVYAPHASLLTLTGGGVSQWTNAQGTAARNAEQATPDSRPGMSATNAIAGYPSLVFGDPARFLTISQALALEEYTLYAVLRRNATSAMAFMGDNNSDGIGFNGGSSLETADGGNGAALSLSLGASQWALLRLRSTGFSGLRGMLLPGTTEVVFSVSGTVPNFSSAPVSIGRGFTTGVGANTPWVGQIAELIITTQGVNIDAETNRISNLLMRKYGFA